MSYSDFRFVEIAKYVPKIKAVIREKRDDQSVMPSVDELDTWRDKHNNTGVYCSVFRYMKPHLDAPRCSPLYFDLDSEDHLSISHADALNIYRYLLQVVPEESIVVYFTGAKGFHIEVSASSLGVSPSMDLAAIFRLIAEEVQKELQLTTLDFAVYEPRRMWRLPNSRHQKTGLYKIELLRGEFFSSLETITNIAREPRYLEPLPADFSPMANEWLKSWVTELDNRKEKAQADAAKRRLEMFNKYGTSILKGPSHKYVKAVWESAVAALRDTEPGKNRNLTLSRQAYRLYITALEANMNIEEVTNKLYDIGIDIGLEQREVRATLNSALRGAKRKSEQEVNNYV